MYFVAIVLFVYDDYCFSFVSLCDHCIVFLSTTPPTSTENSPK